MPNAWDESLGAQHTTDGPCGDRADAASLGDQGTLVRGDADLDSEIDAELEIVDLSKRYTIERVLGRGGMGIVYLAKDNRLDRQVAIKRMLDHVAASRAARKRFLAEARSVAKLDQPNIVRVYELGRDAEGLFLIMEYVDGSSLHERCHDGTPMALDEAVEIICQLCDGLAKAHEAGIIHRDIKPANVLLTTDGRPKLSDFGLARQDTTPLGISVSGGVLGTPDYMAPEQQGDSRQVDQRSDLWSLAATFYRMVTGRSPRVIHLQIAPAPVQAVLGKALEYAREDRYQNACEFRDALRSALRPDTLPLVAPAELGSGECPQCRTVNEPHRKFCRNPNCAAPLRVRCLKCDTEIPVWDDVCFECGAKQAETLAARQHELAALRDECETLLGFFAFERAAACAAKLADEQDRRLQPFKEWAEAFLPKIAEEKRLQEDKARGLFSEARAHRRAFDYASAIDALSRVPKPLMTSEISRFLERLSADKEEAERLVADIRDRIKQRNLDGLLPLVARAVELRGDRADLQRLREQLLEREARTPKPEPYQLAPQLRVETTPPGAKVTIDGRAEGVSPCQVELQAGEYEVRVELDGFLPAAQQVHFDGASDRLVEFDMEPMVVAETRPNQRTLSVEAAEAEFERSYGQRHVASADKPQDASEQATSKEQPSSSEPQSDGPASPIPGLILGGLIGAFSGLTIGLIVSFFLEGYFTEQFIGNVLAIVSAIAVAVTVGCIQEYIGGVPNRALGCLVSLFGWSVVGVGVGVGILFGPTHVISSMLFVTGGSIGGAIGRRMRRRMRFTAITRIQAWIGSTVARQESRGSGSSLEQSRPRTASERFWATISFIDQVLERMAGRGNTLVHNFLRCFTIAAVIVLVMSLVAYLATLVVHRTPDRETSRATRLFVPAAVQFQRSQCDRSEVMISVRPALPARRFVSTAPCRMDRCSFDDGSTSIHERQGEHCDRHA
ncbi:MAG: protein kinase [Pirellulaceae bacterium]|nr:protein kinase [Pirellulaceae bacterium]